MDIKRFGTRQRMSTVNEYNGVLYFQGKTASDTSVTAAEQTEQILTELEALLKEYGSDKNHILSALIHLHNFNDFESINAVWDSWTEMGHAPGRTCVGGVVMDGGALVEITIVAAVKE